MIYLLLSILSSTLVAVVIRWNEGRGVNRFGALFFNYATAGTLGLFLLGGASPGEGILQLLPLSLFAGGVFVAAFYVYMATVNRSGLSITVTVTRLSVIIPVLGSLIIFREKLSLVQVSGLLLALLAIYFFSRTPNQTAKSGGQNLWLLPVLLFFLVGGGDFSLKIFQEIHPVERMPLFMVLVFCFSTLFSLLLLLMLRIQSTWNTIAGGIVLGIPNFLSAYFILKLLRHLPGALAFPLNNIGIIILSTLGGWIFWREKPPRTARLAILMAIVAVFLLNLS